jgi:hypothetical protein
MKIHSDYGRMGVAVFEKGKLVIQESATAAVLHELQSAPYEDRNLSIYENKHIFYKIEHRCNKYKSDICFEIGMGRLVRKKNQLILERDNPMGGCLNGCPVSERVPLPEEEKFAVTMPAIDIPPNIPHFRFGEEVYIAEPETHIYIDKDSKIQTLTTKQLQDKLHNNKPKLSSLQLSKSTRPAKPKDGTLIWNPRTGNLEFYDGEWKTIGLK